MLKTWPNGLPLFEMEWTLKPKDNLITSQSDRGSIKKRRKSSVPKNLISGSIDYSESQLTTFLNFVNLEIEEGANPFYINDFISNKVQKAFLKNWGLKRTGVNSYRVDLEIEVENI